MSTFVDSSALVKLYADEPDHLAIRGLSSIVVSCLARVEVPAAIWRKHRNRELSEVDASVLTAEFESDYFGTDRAGGRFVITGIMAAVLDAAAALVAAGGLRAYDAVQLASACAARAAEPSCTAFACTDRALRRAAAAEGFTVVP